MLKRSVYLQPEGDIIHHYNWLNNLILITFKDCIYICIYIRLKIKPNSVRIRFLGDKFVFFFRRNSKAQTTTFIKCRGIETTVIPHRCEKEKLYYLMYQFEKFRAGHYVHVNFVKAISYKFADICGFKCSVHKDL